MNVFEDNLLNMTQLCTDDDICDDLLLNVAMDGLFSIFLEYWSIFNHFLLSLYRIVCCKIVACDEKCI